MILPILFSLLFMILSSVRSFRPQGIIASRARPERLLQRYGKKATAHKKSAKKRPLVVLRPFNSRFIKNGCLFRNTGNACPGTFVYLCIDKQKET